MLSDWRNSNCATIKRHQSQPAVPARGQQTVKPQSPENTTRIQTQASSNATNTSDVLEEAEGDKSAEKNSTAEKPNLAFLTSKASTSTVVPDKDDFQVNEHNLDTDSHTWRPMKVDKNGDLRPVQSELLTNHNSDDTWLPNVKHLKERD